MPAVVIKRKRTVAVPDADGTGLAEGVHLEACADLDRAPRVFRVDTRPVPITTPTPMPPAAGSAPAVASSADVLTAPVPVAGTRPRRRVAPAVVTKFITEREEALTDDFMASRGHQQADELLGRLAALEATFAMIRNAQDFSLVSRPEGSRGHPASAGYPALRTEIERLQRVAEAAREAEAPRAIAWIRHAIETYGLTWDELF